jgi:hypothetical protein
VTAEAERAFFVNGAKPGPTTPQLRALAEVNTVFRRWLYLEDLGTVYVTLAGIAANLMPGDPLWIMLVGGSSNGKTESMGATSGLPNVHLVSTLTEAGLLSGTPKREKDAASTGGLLRQIGDFGILECKDFTSVLAMHRDTRATLLAGLREIYDGSWTRNVGVDGGRTLHWQGKIGLIAGCTAAIDSHHAVISTMGERFVFWRLPDVDADKQASRSLDLAGREREMREDLRRAVEALFDEVKIPDRLPELSEGETDRLVALSSLVARARSAVDRDGYTREIELILDPEAPPRLAKSLRRLYSGLVVIGLDRDEAMKLTTKAGFDSLPKIRRTVFDQLAGIDEWQATTAIATTAGYPTKTAYRALEDLTVHHVAERRSGGNGKPDEWRLSDWAREHYDRTRPTGTEKSEGYLSEGSLTNPQTLNDDFSVSLADFKSAPDSEATSEDRCWKCGDAANQYDVGLRPLCAVCAAEVTT